MMDLRGKAIQAVWLKRPGWSKSEITMLIDDYERELTAIREKREQARRDGGAWTGGGYDRVRMEDLG